MSQQIILSIYIGVIDQLFLLNVWTNFTCELCYVSYLQPRSLHQFEAHYSEKIVHPYLLHQS